MAQNQYAEFDPNSAPQVVVHDAPEVMQMGNLGTGNDGVVEPAWDDSVAQPPQDNPGALKAFCQSLARHKKILISIVALLLLATVLPVVIMKAILRAQWPPPNSPGSGSTPTTFTPEISSSIPLPTPSSTLVPAPECNSSKFLRDVNWIGIDNGVGWNFTLTSAQSPQDCCAVCHQSVPEGCNGWLYVKTNTNTPACNIIPGFSGPNKTKSCPSGRPSLVFSNNGDLPPGQGGLGPCADEVRN
ncbi:unnamed protein product [Colletotrichum noveboracense]|uniref:Uncharacterized protein n=1 Tax=Colletotrichum noveboracense TaxID=2664923 RepID=A0A9W4WQQ4_9PEZI|nr:hypothetical protein K456DRAFT_1723529 [Colletotrichum gloeosporioides 23]CAI0653701.1 unnamed protein product [Colletotrichum noveboracense]